MVGTLEGEEGEEEEEEGDDDCRKIGMEDTEKRLALSLYLATLSVLDRNSISCRGTSDGLAMLPS